MFITRNHLSRRTFLRGTGVTLALPFLEAMLPAQTPLASSTALPKTRFAGIFFPHGMAPGHWVPKAEGANFELPFIMEPLRASSRPRGHPQRPPCAIGRTSGGCHRVRSFCCCRISVRHEAEKNDWRRHHGR